MRGGQFALLCSLAAAGGAAGAPALYYVALENSEDPTWEQVAEAFDKLGVSETTAASLVDELNAKGAALVLEGPRARCDKAVALFGALGMRATVYPAPPPMSSFAGPHVAELDESTIRAALGGGQLWLLQFYAPWCGHCRKLSPAFNAAAALAAPTGARFGVVNCDKHARLCQAAGVKGYPTLKRAVGGVIAGEYAGGRSTVAMALFAAGQSAVAGISRLVGGAFRPLIRAVGLGRQRRQRQR